MEGKIKLFYFPLIFILLVISFPTGSSQNIGHILIYEVSPYPYPGTEMEYICLYNPTNYTQNLDEYYITDFEGFIYLNGSMAPHSKIYIAENASSFLKYMGFPPDFTYQRRGKFALANKGDEVALFKDNTLIDIVIYGDSHYNGTGWYGDPLKITQGHILRRVSYNDTDTSMDWDNYHTIAQSDFKPSWFEASMEVFPYPDEWKEVIRFMMDSKDYLYVETYTLDSFEFEEALLSKMREGVDVSILLEGNPIGGINNYEKSIIHTLWVNGAEIFFMKNSPKEHIYDRYRFIHSKFIVKDGKEVLISTENFGKSALNPCGNRGYGVIVRSSEFSKYMEDIFTDDRKSVRDIERYNGEFQNISIPHEDGLTLRRKTFGSINITARFLPIVAPDFAPEYFKKFIDSQRALYVEALYIDDAVWNEIRNKTDGVLVEEELEGNNVKIFDGKMHYISHLHAKLIIGDSQVLVGSMNLGISSMKYNREISLWIDSDLLSSYLRQIFQYDWNEEYKPIGVMSIKIIGNSIDIDLTESLGEIAKYYVYLDGELRYEGKNARIILSVQEGEHAIKVVMVDKWGNQEVIKSRIYISKDAQMDIRIPLILIIFAAFLYKVWKDHG